MVSSSLSVFEYVSFFLPEGAASQGIKMVRFSIVTLFYSIITHRSLKCGRNRKILVS